MLENDLSTINSLIKKLNLGTILNQEVVVCKSPNRKQSP
jgi:hypothetical protein